MIWNRKRAQKLIKTDLLPVRREGWAGQDHESLHSGQNRRTSFVEVVSRFPLHPAPEMSDCGPASLLWMKYLAMLA